MRNPNIPAVPLTMDNFETEYKISTGLQHIGLSWIINHTPDSQLDKELFFVKLARNIQLNKDSYSNGKLIKYGRLRFFDKYPSNVVTDSSQQDLPEYCTKTTELKPSWVVDMLQNIIFGEQELRYAANDENLYLLTSDGQRLLIT